MWSRRWTPERIGRWSVIALLGLAAGCGLFDSPSPVRSTLQVGVLPDQSEEELRRQYDPLVRYLGTTSGLELELVIPDSYDDLLARFHDGELELAWFGGVTFLQAERQSKARPLVMREVDLEFTSSFFVADISDARSFEDLAGGTLAFGPQLSTSGHLMPRSYLSELGISPTEFFRVVRHSRGHDETVAWVRDGEVDLGAVNSVTLETMLQDGRLSAGQVRVLDVTHPYRNYVWAAPAELDRRTRIRLMDAFLALDVTNPAHAEILELQGSRGYVPASTSDYEELRTAAVEHGFIDNARRR